MVGLGWNVARSEGDRVQSAPAKIKHCQANWVGWLQPQSPGLALPAWEKSE